MVSGRMLRIRSRRGKNARGVLESDMKYAYANIYIAYMPLLYTICEKKSSLIAVWNINFFPETASVIISALIIAGFFQVLLTL